MTSTNLVKFLSIFLRKADRCLATLLCWLISSARPMLGTENVCPFAIGCTNFAIFNLQEQSVPFALLAIFKRLLICNPIGMIYRKFLVKH